MKRILNAVATCAAKILVSAIVVANMCACSGEELDQLGVSAKEKVVSVEEFSSSIEAQQVSNVEFKTTDGNVLTAHIVGRITPRSVKLLPGAETNEFRTINVVLEGTNDDGVTRTATTSYQQRKSSADEPTPDPVVVDIRLEADTVMMYQANRSDHSNGAFMIINPIKRITTWSDGREETDTLTKKTGLDIFLMGTSTHSDFITNSPKVEECVFWNGLKLEDETSENKTLEIFSSKESGEKLTLDYVETKQYIRVDITAMSDANAECSVAPQIVLTSRTVKFTDPESGKSIEWTSKGEVKFASRESINEGREALHEPEGDYAYKGTHKVTLDVIHNGTVKFANFIATTAIYNK